MKRRPLLVYFYMSILHSMILQKDTNQYSFVFECRALIKPVYHCTALHKPGLCYSNAHPPPWLNSLLPTPLLSWSR